MRRDAEMALRINEEIYLAERPEAANRHGRHVDHTWAIKPALMTSRITLDDGSGGRFHLRALAARRCGAVRRRGQRRRDGLTAR